MPTPPISLISALEKREIIRKGCHWVNLQGGRSNRTWRMDDRTDQIVCKLYPKVDDNPLFPNLAGAEYLALKALEGKGLAPTPIQLLNTEDGPCLVYEYIQGNVWKRNNASVKTLAETVRRLHSERAPARFTKDIPIASKLLLQGQRILARCNSLATSEFPDAPKMPYIEEVSPVFLHGDLVPANIVQETDGIRFIDWQCPALGDPCEDFAIFISPAMQTLYGGTTFTPTEINALFQHYGNETMARRYEILKPLFHWRMAAYCQWKTEQGAEDYRPARDLELRALEESLLE